jgi:DNA-binding transcriptional LysR family regulator
MARPDWLRTFVAVYRTGSVTEGARSRHLSQPAASQQLAGLERAVGAPLFTRHSDGVLPTRHGHDLYAAVAEPLDRLEGVLDGLDGGVVRAPVAPLRLGAGAECLAGVVLPRLGPLEPAVHAVVGDDATLFAQLAAGELDVTVTSATAPRRAAVSTVIGVKRFVLVAAPSLAPARPHRSTARLGEWLVGAPWVSYSAELPVTRRFWLDAFGRTFAADLRLVAPDLRVVATAVELGLGISLLPEFVCRAALDAGRLVEIHPVRDLVAPEPWYASVRHADAESPRWQEVLHRLRGSPVSPVGEPD